jgi:uncharacterized protein (UPF0548 family)
MASYFGMFAPNRLRYAVGRLPLLLVGLFFFVRGLQIADVWGVLIGSFLVMLVVAFQVAVWAAIRQEHRRQLETGWLDELPVTYPVARIGTSVERSAGETRATIGTGREKFDSASAAVMRWEVKTRSGFQVIRVGKQGAFFSEEPVTKGECAVVRLGLLRETVRVVRVVEEPRRRGFAYGTLPEHPLRGEEAFLVEWGDDDRVELVIRSFSRPNGWAWALLWPGVMIARNIFLRRYRRALLD